MTLYIIIISIELSTLVIITRKSFRADSFHHGPQIDYIKLYIRELEVKVKYAIRI